MSGGHYNGMEYRILMVADDIANDLKRYGHEYSKEIVSKIGETEHCLRRASEMLLRVDYLISGDDDDETFLKRLENEVRKCKCNIKKIIK